MLSHSYHAQFTGPNLDHEVLKVVLTLSSILNSYYPKLNSASWMLSPRKRTTSVLLTKSRKPWVTQLIFLKNVKTISPIPPCLLLPCTLIVLDNEDWRVLYLLQQGTREVVSHSDTLPGAVVWCAPCSGAQHSRIVLRCQCHNVATLQIALLSSHTFSLWRCSHLFHLVKMDGNVSNCWEKEGIGRKMCFPEARERQEQVTTTNHDVKSNGSSLEDRADRLVYWLYRESWLEEATRSKLKTIYRKSRLF